AGEVTSDGARQVPLSTVAATWAMSSALTLMPPCPTVCAARDASREAFGTEPGNVGTGSFQSPPMPYCFAAAAIVPGLSLRDSPANAVLQVRAKFSRKFGVLSQRVAPDGLWK